MARYIDADKVLQELGEEPSNWTNSDTEIQEQFDYRAFKSIVESQPTADVVEVKHGKWQEERWCDNFQHTCSLCHSTVRVHPQSVAYKYCPYCGAIMDGERSETNG